MIPEQVDLLAAPDYLLVRLPAATTFDALIGDVLVECAQCDAKVVVPVGLAAAIRAYGLAVDGFCNNCAALTFVLAAPKTLP